MSMFPFVMENGDLFCTCTTSDLGLPRGRLIGYYGGQRLNASNFGSGYLSFEKRNLTRTDDGTSVKCVVDWATQDTDDLNTSFTLRIAYGPDAVIITGPDVFDINPSQVQSISLICKESVVSPYVNYTWAGCPSGNPMSPICTARPSLNNTSYFVQCTVSNPLTQVARTVNHTVELNYPPGNAPVISTEPSLNPSQPVYKGDNFTLTCTVHGGKPVNATRVTFACPHMIDMGDIIGTTEVNSSLTFFSVSSDNQGNCSCSAMWKNTTWYTQTAEWTLIVYTPPSVPKIFPLSDSTGKPAYPFMVGTSGTLSCQSNQSGQPEATFTWPASDTGHASGSNLTFHILSRENNGRTVKCSASNNYTENRQPVDNATFVLQVYYGPIVNFTHISTGSSCVEDSSKSVFRHCVVSEGQRIHINCTADSNPAPASFQWLSPSKDVYSNTSELMIMSANHTIHNGDYNCTVITKQVDMDSRLPLTSSSVLTVIVGYSPSILNFSLNNVDNMIVYVQEKSRIDMKCVCNGRPTPSIQLINVTDPNKFLNESKPTGDIFVDEQTGEVSLSIDQVPCEASGVYQCNVVNSLGQGSQNRTLLVYCAPRGTFDSGENPNAVVNVTSGKGELFVKMTAYPTPMAKTITYLGHNKEISGGNLVTANTISVECTASLFAPAAFTCHIRVINITTSDEGFYRIVFSNDFGELPFTFSVKGKGGQQKLRSRDHPEMKQKKTTDDDGEMINNEIYAGSEIFEHGQVQISSAQGNNLSAGKTSRPNKKGKGKKKVKASISMGPDTVYENVAFESTERDHTNSPGNLNKHEHEKIDNAVQQNKDGLIYSSLDFDERKSAKPPPPKREETEYVSIDLKKTALLQHKLNSD
ncbi:hypothetical protein C0Q70_12967 [Pomacea canaliculata]|uniref:Ig-like domain-containing protein n=1 Tax=Pomacea canaliculata TaxID=400727 RepID=A0A2T7P300_POMCA|nr:hypothetical protein C0Q70_12967 [Pomacea canaliculata]